MAEVFKCLTGSFLITMLFCGCIANHTRTGELGLLTKRQFQIVSAAYHSNDSEMNPFAAVAPFEIIGAGIVGLTYAPCVDALCSPYDLFIKLSGDKICVVDDDGLIVPDVDIELYGSADALMLSNGSHALHDEAKGRTGKDGIFRTCRRLKSIPNAYCRLSKKGYYVTSGGANVVFNAEDAHVRAVLMPIKKPIPLYVKKVVFPNLDKTVNELSEVEKGSFSYDFVKGDWLPPWGQGEVADVVFRRLPREDLGVGVNGRGQRNRSFKDVVAVDFQGGGNGIVAVPVSATSELKIRTSVDSGFAGHYEQVCGRGKDLQAFRMYDESKCLCFRVRTKYDDKGKVVEAFYGKIYGDIAMGWSYQGVSSVSFLYYFNPTPNDRNLEWDMKNNLCSNSGDLGKYQP